ncbi:hypothetical protein GQ53DRAFT_106383 [Thozetella sp. PMI_491]|nr:hypothetical protein GQ53DRAFT_106383 [Thozetella sp. PMI_491]
MQTDVITAWKKNLLIFFFLQLNSRPSFCSGWWPQLQNLILTTRQAHRKEVPELRDRCQVIASHTLFGAPVGGGEGRKLRPLSPHLAQVGQHPGHCDPRLSDTPAMEPQDVSVPLVRFVLSLPPSIPPTMSCLGRILSILTTPGLDRISSLDLLSVPDFSSRPHLSILNRTGTTPTLDPKDAPGRVVYVYP